MKNKVCLGVVALAMSGIASASVTIVALEPVYGHSTAAAAINNHRVVVGASGNSVLGWNGDAKAVLWNADGRAQILSPDSISHAWPTDLSDRGHIVGTYELKGTFTPYPCEWREGVFASLERAFGGASAVNIHGISVGQFNDRPVMWHNGTHTFLSESEGGFATGINARDEISGTEFMNDTNVACVWRDGDLITLGVPGEFASVAHGINDLGTAVGVRSWGQYISEGFIYRDDQLTNIGTLGFDGSALIETNNLHQMIGIVWNLDHPKSFPVDIWGMMYADGHMVLLEDLVSTNSGWTRLEAYDINDHMQLAGYGTFNGQLRGFVISIHAGDVDGDTFANIDDLLAVIHAWGDCPATDQTCPADLAPLGGDGVVNIDDLLQVIQNWD